MINNRKYVLSTGTSDAAKWVSFLSSWEEYIEPHVHFIVQNSEFTRKLGKLVMEMAEVQNCMSWLVPLRLCDLQVIQLCSNSSTSSNCSTCYWVMEAQCTPGFASWGAGTYCWLSPYGHNFCWFSRILFLEVSKTPVNFRFRDLLSFQHASLWAHQIFSRVLPMNAEKGYSVCNLISKCMQLERLWVLQSLDSMDYLFT